jgi:predicted nuclease of restriction endonuclease-like (RecB) superfamily
MPLAERLQREFGGGYSESNLRGMRAFYLAYPGAVKTPQIQQPLAAESRMSMIGDEKFPPMAVGLSTELSWRHYQALMRIDSRDARSFYEIEAVKRAWSARELERQVASLLFERLARSSDKDRLMTLATKGQLVEKPSDVFKDPVVMEFLGLPETPALTESSLECALLSNLQSFLLELGSGFAFVARQQRVTLDGDHFYIDLVFYHSVLKCFVLVDLKVGKLTHGDLGQLQLYVNFYDLERRAPDDNPTLGLILCSDKNDAVVRYTLGPNQEEKIFASRYKLHLPSEEDLRAQLQTR